MTAERTGTRKRPDIFIDDQKAISSVAIECAYGGDNDKDAIAARLDQAVCKTAVAVRVPLHFKDVDSDGAGPMLRNGCEIDYALLQRHGDDTFRFPAKGHAVGSARDLASLIHAAAVPKDQVESVADDVVGLIDRAAETLELGLSDFNHHSVVNKVHQSSPLSALRTVAVLCLNAMVVQQHLRTMVGDKIDVLPFGGIKPSTLAKSWRRILERNWQSIFTPAVIPDEIRGDTSGGLLDASNRCCSTRCPTRIGRANSSLNASNPAPLGRSSMQFNPLTDHRCAATRRGSRTTPPGKPHTPACDTPFLSPAVPAIAHLSAGGDSPVLSIE